MWNGRPEDAAHRSGVLRAMRAQSMEFSELNVEFGYCYESAAVVPDGSAAPAPADDIRPPWRHRSGRSRRPWVCPAS
jgi:2,4-dichlorophenol 6-monooxygenase